MRIEPEKLQVEKPPKMEREDLLEESKLGFDFFFTKFPHVSKLQILWFFLVNYCWVVGGLVQVGSIILQATPEFRCRSVLDNRYNTSYEEGLLFSPKDSCSQFVNLESLCSETMSLEACLEQLAENSGVLEVESCSSGYIFDDSIFTRTVTTDFELVCENAYIESTISSIFFAGLFFGVFIFGPITDKIGRTKASVIASVCLVIVQIPLIFLPKSAGVWSYAIIRMISGFFSISAGTGTFVYTMEVVGPKYRTWFGCMTQGIFAVGYALLSLVGYLLKDWQDQMIVLTLAPIFVIPIFLYLPYSTAWIFSQNQYEDARENVKLIGKKYAIETDEKFLNELESAVKAQQKSDDGGKIYTQIDLFKPKKMRLITLVEMYQWFSTTLVFYGLGLGVGNLGSNLFISNFINAMIDIVCYILLPSFMDLKCIGRKYGTVWTMLLGSVGCFLTAVFDYLENENPENSSYGILKATCAFAGKFGVAGTFGIVYVHASEMFPTPVRGIGVGLSSAGGRIGGMVAPLINGLGNKTSWLPFVVFGVLGIGQILTAFLLPETLGVPMLTTIEEAEEFYHCPEKFKKSVEDKEIN